MVGRAKDQRCTFAYAGAAGISSRRRSASTIAGCPAAASCRWAAAKSPVEWATRTGASSPRRRPSSASEASTGSPLTKAPSRSGQERVGQRAVSTSTGSYGSSSVASASAYAAAVPVGGLRGSSPLAGCEQASGLRVGHGQGDGRVRLSLDDQPGIDALHRRRRPDVQPAGQVLHQAAQPTPSSPAQRTGRGRRVRVAVHGEGVGPRSGQTAALPVRDHRREGRVGHREVRGADVHRPPVGGPAGHPATQPPTPVADEHRPPGPLHFDGRRDAGDAAAHDQDRIHPVMVPGGKAPPRIGPTRWGRTSSGVRPTPQRSRA